MTVLYFFYCKIVFPSKTITNVDPSCKTDPDLWNWLRRVKCVTAKIHRTDIVTGNDSREEKYLQGSYRREKTKFPDIFLTLIQISLTKTIGETYFRLSCYLL